MCQAHSQCFILLTKLILNEAVRYVLKHYLHFAGEKMGSTEGKVTCLKTRIARR